MIIDASGSTGFRLLLDADSLEVDTDGTLVFSRTARTAESMQHVLRSPGAVSALDQEMYYTYYPMHAGKAQHVLDRYKLTYSLVVMPSLSIDGEFVKTQGHYHTSMPGTPYGYPEVYTQLWGHLLLFLQKRNGANPDTPLDCVLIDMTPGTTVIVPPDYAHVLINTTDKIALMAGLYSPEFKPDYTEVYAHRGLAYYILDQGGDITIEPNPRYTNPPPLREPDALTGTIFVPPHPDKPVWEAFITEPESYSFLTQPDAMKAYFNLA